ncbi:hypothetical protein COV16_01020, partial [Candidatus Woesearchaeota archaeon CG10_big_fil_rev_8_21_14_0_10_34_8]
MIKLNPLNMQLLVLKLAIACNRILKVEEGIVIKANYLMLQTRGYMSLGEKKLARDSITRAKSMFEELTDHLPG